MADDGVIRWEEPPPVPLRGDAKRPWSLVAAQLRARPGDYALIAEGAGAELAPRINTGVSWWAPPGAYKAVSRKIDGRLCVWAVYLGPAAASTKEGTP
jgi:hypothetical protein